MIQAILAASEGFDASAIAPLLSSVGAVGIAVWHTYYTTTTTIPDMQRAHAAERLSDRDVYMKQIDNLVSEMRSQRAEFQKWREEHLTKRV